RMQEVADASAGWFDEFAKDLGLSDEQKQRVHDAMAKAKPQLEEDRAKVREAFDEFRKDAFSMEHVAPAGQIGERTRKRAETMIGLAKELAAILTPEQRAKLAERVEHRKHQQATALEIEDEEQSGQARQEFIAAGGYRAGAVRGWGGGGAYASRTVA